MPYHFRLCKHYVCKVKTRCARFFYPPYLKKNIIFFNLLRLKEPAQSTQSVPIRFLPFHYHNRNSVSFVFVSLTPLCYTHSLRLFVRSAHHLLLVIAPKTSFLLASTSPRYIFFTAIILQTAKFFLQKNYINSLNKPNLNVCNIMFCQ